MKFKFEKLIIWQKAMDLAEAINVIAHKFPKEELYNLCSQIRRAADSIALNISEGAIAQSNLEQKRRPKEEIISQKKNSLSGMMKLST